MHALIINKNIIQLKNNGITHSFDRQSIFFIVGWLFFYITEALVFPIKKYLSEHKYNNLQQYCKI